MPYHSTIGCVLPIAMSEWGDGVVLLTIIDLTITAEEMLALLGHANITYNIFWIYYIPKPQTPPEPRAESRVRVLVRSTGIGTGSTGMVYSS